MVSFVLKRDATSSPLSGNRDMYSRLLKYVSSRFCSVYYHNQGQLPVGKLQKKI